MKHVQISDIAAINPRTPPEVRRDRDAYATFLPMASVTEAGRLIAQEQRRVGDLLSGFCYFARGDVLLAKITPCFENGKAVHLTDLATEFGFGSTEFHVLRPGPDIDGRYLFHLVHSPSFRASRAPLMRGAAGQRRVASSDITRSEIALPPLEVQQRIAATLDRMDEMKLRSRERDLVLSQIPVSSFVEMFGDPLRNPHSWPLDPMHRLIDHFEAGSSVGGVERERLADEWAVLKISAVTSGIYNPSENKVAPPPPRALLVIPRRGDLLFSRANTRDLVAATCLVDSDDPRLFLPDKLWRVVPVEGGARVEYLRFLFAHSAFRATVAKRASGTSGSMLNVSQAKVMALLAPRPPMDLQDRFAEIVWRALDLRTRLRLATAQLEALAGALSDRAFRGEL